MQNGQENKNEKQIGNISVNKNDKFDEVAAVAVAAASNELGFIENPPNHFSQKTKEMEENDRFLYPIFINITQRFVNLFGFCIFSYKDIMFIVQQSSRILLKTFLLSQFELYYTKIL